MKKLVAPDYIDYYRKLTEVVFTRGDLITSMARVVMKEAQASHKLQVVDEEGNTRLRGICMCGLSANLPFCIGSHRKAEDEEEGVLYIYNEDGTIEECSIQME